MRIRAAMVFCCLTFLATEAPAQEPGTRDVETLELPAVEPPAVGWLPSLADMELAGAVIGEIRVLPQNIFDLTDPEENYLLYRLANAIHIVTREGLVRQTLLFKTGDRLSVRLIEESERLLRSTLRVYGVSIRPIGYHDGVVDLEVVTRDQWTLEASVSFGRSGGVNRESVALKENNLFGTATSLEYSRSANVDRTSNTITVSHPHALGPYASASASYSDTSDGRAWAVSVNRPFYALDTRSTWGASADNSVRSDAVYVSGVNTGTYRHEQSNAGVFGGWSEGLVDGWTRRHTVGISHQENTYASIPGQ